MCPALHPLPNFARGVSCGVFSTSLKSRTENHDDLSQTQCRPGTESLLNDLRPSTLNPTGHDTGVSDNQSSK